MKTESTNNIAIIVPNWNGEDHLRECLDSLLQQSIPADIIVVDNGSVDSSKDILREYRDKLIALFNKTNLGFAGGVNTGIRYVLDRDYTAVALFNNDAVADEDWLKNLLGSLVDQVGIVTCRFQAIDGKTIDSTGEHFTTWGLPFPRGRGRLVSEFEHSGEATIFGASGGATLYSVAMLREIGIFDEDFFAYFEDVDISFRAQLAGWKVLINPKAIAYHHISATSKRMKSANSDETVEIDPHSTRINAFSAYQSLKNWPLVIIKNVPNGLLPMILPRFLVAYLMFILSSIIVHRHPFLWVKAITKVISLLPKKLKERQQIQKSKKVSDDYILSIMTHDLPENQTKLRKLRDYWWKVAKEPAKRGQ